MRVPSDLGTGDLSLGLTTNIRLNCAHSSSDPTLLAEGDEAEKVSDYSSKLGIMGTSRYQLNVFVSEQ